MQPALPVGFSLDAERKVNKNTLWVLFHFLPVTTESGIKILYGHYVTPTMWVTFRKKHTLQG